MLSALQIQYIEDLLNDKVKQSQPLSGGDINDVYLLDTVNLQVVVKKNSASRFPDMFEKEAQGLKVLRDTKTFTIPEVLGIGALSDTSFLLLEYIQPQEKHKDFWEIFGSQLASLHQNSTSHFGFESDNYIGSLWQYNKLCNSSVDFYITQRLQPQFILASQKGFSFQNLDVFYKNIEKEIPNELSSLIHGDLWNGNYTIGIKGFPSLIDPAVAYAPREMDIAMMHLFGGFDPQLFLIYNEIYPLQGNWKDRMSLWQLYYVLVHLNIFGSSYYNRVQQIINRYQ
ncbi:fructosamine kinase family protein [Aquimarina litoralis]|uniref:fructosamine kinase family protein n=1 Tax=Aquimarina litoralis TaxID=584605 RepID=UPI001C5A158A|nr:fructosamine kinase family protein [Aquimarina litoralis]MBW1294392.1 phosphotransferase [Aquimarina litoralis]